MLQSVEISRVVNLEPRRFGCGDVSLRIDGTETSAQQTSAQGNNQHHSQLDHIVFPKVRLMKQLGLVYRRDTDQHAHQNGHDHQKYHIEGFLPIRRVLSSQNRLLTCMCKITRTTTRILLLKHVYVFGPCL